MALREFTPKKIFFLIPTSTSEREFNRKTRKLSDQWIQNKTGNNFCLFPLTLKNVGQISESNFSSCFFFQHSLMTAAQITRFISKSKKPFSIYADFLGRCCVWQTYALHQQHHRIPHPQPKYTESKKKKFRKLNECKSINLLGLSSTNKVPARILCGKIGKSAEFKVLLTELFLLRSFAFCFPNISVRLKKKKWIYLLSYHSKFTNAAASTEPSQKWAKNREREKK